MGDDDQAKQPATCYVDDALWPSTAWELLCDLSKPAGIALQALPDDFEKIGRYILEERRRKYREGYAAGKHDGYKEGFGAGRDMMIRERKRT